MNVIDKGNVASYDIPLTGYYPRFSDAIRNARFMAQNTGLRYVVLRQRPVGFPTPTPWVASWRRP